MQQVGSCKAGTRVQGPLVVPDQQLTMASCIAFQILARGVQGHLARRLQDYFTLVNPVERTDQPGRILPDPSPGPMSTRARKGIHRRESSALPAALALKRLPSLPDMAYRWLGS